MLRMFADVTEEATSIIAWVERRLPTANNSGMVAAYQRQFKRMWLESFGTLADVPPKFKAKMNTLYDELKSKEATQHGER